jgi:1-acyl-sn-glycerol-3-phosphate acyltransferase
MVFLRRCGFTCWVIGSMMVLFLPSLLSRRFARWAMKALWAPPSLALAGVKVEVVRYGSSEPWPLPEDAPVILVANHGSHLDIPILVAAFHWAPRYVAKLELGKIPLLAYYIRRTGSVLIDREKNRSAARSLDQAVEAASTGAPLAFFAAGTRSPDDKVQPFRNGAFVVARRAKLPVVPIAIVGSHACMAKGARMPSPGLVQIVVGDPIAPPEGSAAAFAKQVRAKVGEMHASVGGAGLA